MYSILCLVIQCKDLARSTGSSINAYVKCAILPSDNGHSVHQRTIVYKDSNNPCFDYRFIFDRKEGDQEKWVQLAVWHRDRECK